MTMAFNIYKNERERKKKHLYNKTQFLCTHVQVKKNIELA